MIPDTKLHLPDWTSLDTRPVPGWFDEAKLGIFIHFGLYSVPAFGLRRKDTASSGEAYAEWYGHFMNLPGNPVREAHRRLYGETFRYADFVDGFRCGLFDPDRWADLFFRSGARYIHLTAKHHDGYCLWPSRFAWNWNSLDTGPHRDLVGELLSAVERKGLHPGLYYSLYEWNRPGYREDPESYALRHMIPQMKELVETYLPHTLFTDGEWDHPSAVWHSEEFLAWLFNESPVRDIVAVNDRWGRETRSVHGGYFTTEYNEVHSGVHLVDTNRKWEENRGIGHSFGYNRNEPLEDYLSEDELVRLFVDVVSRGGNLCLNVGPMADGTIPTLMEERLLQLGHWLSVNGEGIYGSRPVAGSGDGNVPIRMTGKDRRIWCFLLEWPADGVLRLRDFPWIGQVSGVRFVGRSIPSLEFRQDEAGLAVMLPYPSPTFIPCRSAWGLQIELRVPA